jgi:hypothetical protein
LELEITGFHGRSGRVSLGKMNWVARPNSKWVAESKEEEKKMKILATLGFSCLMFLAGCGTASLSTVGGLNPVPSIVSLAPTSAVTGGASFTLTVYGDNFTSSSVVNFGGTPETTIFISATQVTASIPAVAIATAGMASVTVTNPGSTGGHVESLEFRHQQPKSTTNGYLYHSYSCRCRGRGFYVDGYGNQFRLYIGGQPQRNSGKH